MPVKAAPAGAGKAEGVSADFTARLALYGLVQLAQAGGADVEHAAALGADEMRMGLRVRIVPLLAGDGADADDVPVRMNMARFRYTVPRLRSGYSGFSLAYSISALGCSVVLRRASSIACRFLLYLRASILTSKTIIILITMLI